MARATSSLPVPLSPGDEHGEIVTLQPLNLRDHARHRGAGGQKSWQQRLERRIRRHAGGPRRSIARGAQGKSLLRDRRNHANPPHDGMSHRPRRRDQHEPRPFAIASQRLEDHRVAPRRVTVQRRSGQHPGSIRVAAREGDHAHVAVGLLDEQDRAVGAGGFEQRRGGFASEQFGQRRRIHDPPHDRIVGVDRGDDVFAGAYPGQQRFGGVGVGHVALGAKLFEDRQRGMQVAFGHRARTGLGDSRPRAR